MKWWNNLSADTKRYIKILTLASLGYYIANDTVYFFMVLAIVGFISLSSLLWDILWQLKNIYLTLLDLIIKLEMKDLADGK